ncbi:glycosyltransferase [Microbacterium xylanilyticum]
MRAPSRVLIVTHAAEIGGAEIALLRLIGAMDPERFDVIVCVFAPGALQRELVSRGIPVVLLESGGISRVTRADAAAARGMTRNAARSLRLARRLRAVIARERADVVVANSLKAAVITGLASVGRPWVWHLHDRLASDYLARPLVLALRTLARIGPHRVVANSEATAATLGGSRGRRVVVAYPGLTQSAFEDPRPDGATGSIGMVGRVSETKGQRQFLDAMELLAAQGRHEDCRIVGAALFEDGAVERELRDRTRRTPALDAVQWVGWVDDPGRALRELRLLVHASPIPEPFGQVVIEAMAAGVPVIATDAGGVPEILAPDGTTAPIAPGVRRGACGLLVAPGDPVALAAAIGWALDHAAETTEMAAIARAQTRERFPIERAATVVARVWDESRRSAGNPRKKTLSETPRDAI